MKQDVIYITGHQHPDTDSIAAAIGIYGFTQEGQSCAGSIS